LKILVTGATGFIGTALRPALLREGHSVRCLSRHVGDRKPARAQEEWVQADLSDPESLVPAMKDIDVAYYLVHHVGESSDYRTREHRSAAAFSRAAENAGVKKIVYLGGVMPEEAASEHLRSRQETGQILRGGAVPTLELRASMVIGPGSASWQIVRDLSLRLPAMLLPAWLQSRTRPIDIDDVVRALVLAATYPLERSRWFDLPGPDVVTGQEILERVAALRGRRIPMLRVPGLSPVLSSHWLRLVTRAPFSVAKELVLGLTHDLLPKDEGFWLATGQRPARSFDDAARRALESEPMPPGLKGIAMSFEEALVDLLGPKIKG
jgi:uncharacterized protein YbjT (DUF2867 family)